MSQEPGYTLEITDLQMALLGSKEAVYEFLRTKGIWVPKTLGFPICPICYNGRTGEGFLVTYDQARCTTVYKCDPDAHAEHYAWLERNTAAL